MNTVKRWGLIGIAAAPLLGSAAEERKPNIILILADDLGYGDVGFTGGEIQTPHLDRLAAEGVVLTDFHANGATCTPSRAALLTGRYQQRSGLVNALAERDPDYDFKGLAPQEVTLPSLMRGAGYRSALFGKWHLGSQPDAQPLRQGFDVFIGNLGGHVDHISRRGSGGKYDWHNGFELFEEKGYVAHLLTAHALDFIRENQENPFFILLSHACPHGPIQLPGDRPIYIETGIDRSQRAREDKGKYPQMIGEMDAGIGSILDELERLGLDEKTLVIFTSDNGPHPQVGSAGPYRGKKAELYEGGHRVPFAARWPGTIPGGSVRGDTAMLMDLLPTFLDLAGLEPPAEPVMDGISLYPLLRRGNELPRRTLFWDNVGSRAVRDGIWKMVSVRDRPAWRTELYRLDTDPGEARDLSQEHPEILERLRHSHDQWAGEMRRGAISQPFYKPQNESGGSK